MLTLLWGHGTSWPLEVPSDLNYSVIHYQFFKGISLNSTETSSMENKLLLPNFNHLKYRLGNLKNVKLNHNVIYRTWCLLLVKLVIARNHYTGWCCCHFDRRSKDERNKLLPHSQFVSRHQESIGWREWDVLNMFSKPLDFGGSHFRTKISKQVTLILMRKTCVKNQLLDTNDSACASKQWIANVNQVLRGTSILGHLVWRANFVDSKCLHTNLFGKSVLTFNMAFYALWPVQLYISYCVSKVTSLITPIPLSLPKTTFKNTGVQKSLRGIMFALPS